MRKLIVLFGSAFLVSCVSNQNDLDEAFGVAHRSNMEAQIIDMEASQGAPAANGAYVDVAVGRYKADTVKQPNAGGKKGKAPMSGSQGE